MILITDTKQLVEQCTSLEKEGYITVDTEFLRDKFYYPKLCLVQVASENTEFAIDPLAEEIDLTALFEIFANDNIVKVFHSARQDIEIILNLSGKVPSPLFDTQIAAMVCGFGASASYATLVSQICNQNLDKSSRFTDWSRRPLSEKQLSYAISDVTYLRDIYKSLRQNLKENKRESWLDEEMESLTNPDNYVTDPEKAWEKLKQRGTSRRFMGIAKEIAKWRELKAQELNRPKTFILKDTVLLEVAAIAPQTPSELKKIRGVGSLRKSEEIELVEAVERGRNVPDDQLPKKIQKKGKDVSQALVDMLKILLKAKCEELKIAEKILASSDDINKIASGKITENPVFKGWRNEVFGRYAKLLLDGKIVLAVEDGNVMIKEIK